MIHFVTQHKPILEQLDTSRVLATTNIPFLIMGETGTGKELFARHIHDCATHRSGDFVAVNCAGIPEMLLEAELFGTIKGSHSTAFNDRPGLLSQADRGTLFLDEVGDMPYALQAKLLRVLQEKTYRPIGAVKERRADIRIVSATNCDLAEMVYKKTFREDLYYRLKGEVVYIPPLRERKEDILMIARAIDKDYTQQLFGCETPGIDSAAEAWLEENPWPGNVREMQYPLLRGRKLAGRRPMLIHHLYAAVTIPKNMSSSNGLKVSIPKEFDLKKELKKFEHSYLRLAVEQANGNATTAARILGINRTTLVEKMRALT